MTFIGHKRSAAVATLDLEELGLDAAWDELIASPLGLQPGALVKKTELDELERDPRLDATQRKLVSALLSTLRGNLVGTGAVTVSQAGAHETRAANLLALQSAKWVDGESEGEARVRQGMPHCLIGQESQVDAFVRLSKDYLSLARQTPAVMAMTGHVGHGKDQAIAGFTELLLAKPSMVKVDLSGAADRDFDAIFGDDGPLGAKTLKAACAKGAVIRIDGAGEDASGAALRARAPKLAQGLQALLLARRGEPKYFQAAWVFNFDEPQPLTGTRKSPLEQLSGALGSPGARVLSAQAAFSDLDAAAMKRYALERLPKLLSNAALGGVQLTLDDDAADLLARGLATPHAPLDELEHRLLRCVLTHCDTQTSLSREASGVRVSLAPGMRNETAQAAWVAALHVPLPDLQRAEEAFAVAEVAKTSGKAPMRGELLALLQGALDKLADAWVELSTGEASLEEAAEALGALSRTANRACKEAERRHALGKEELLPKRQLLLLEVALSVAHETLAEHAGTAPQMAHALGLVEDVRMGFAALAGAKDLASSPTPTKQPLLDYTSPIAPKDSDVLKGHTYYVTSVAALPDGRIVSGSLDETVRVWNADGSPGPVLKGHTHYVRSVAALPDGRIASASYDKTVRIWNADGTLGPVFEGHTNDVNSVAVLPDGRIVSGSLDKTVRIWNADGSPGPVLTGHIAGVTSVAVLPDGRIVSGSTDKTVRIWNADGTHGPVLTGHTDSVMSVAVLPDGRIVSGSTDNTVRIWNADGTPGPVLVGHTYSVISVAALPDGRIVSGSTDKTVRIWNADGTHGPVLTGHTDSVMSVAVLPDGRIVSGSTDNTVRVWSFEEATS